MRALDIAIIGGGAAGMICAHLLDPRHRITVYERQPILGGNIRTLGRNVACSRLPAGVHLDAGVIEFCPEHFPMIHRLMARLDIETHPVPAATGFLRADGRHLRSPGKLARAPLGPGARWAAKAGLLLLAPELLRFRRRAQAADPDTLYARNLGEFLETGPVSEWLRLLMVYAYSIPRVDIDAMPAALTVPTLLRFTDAPSWTGVRGGVYSYIEQILARLRGEVLTGAVVTVRRDTRGVLVRREGAGARRFDRVVIATTPDAVLDVLEDPSEAEGRRFERWRGNELVTIIHEDDGPYRRRGVTDYAEFDVFERPPGYNAYLNRLAAIEGGARHFHFSYNLETELDPARVLHRQPHRTPRYTVAALATRPEILATQGDRHTYYAGAWLGDGLHEGAARSAVRVSDLLGGVRL